MIITTFTGIALSSALATCPATAPEAVDLYLEVESVAPTHHRPDLPDAPEPEHPAHEDPSAMFRGLVYQNISNTASHVTVNASASGSAAFGAHLPCSIWPENNNLHIVSSVGGLGVNGLQPVVNPQPPSPVNVAPLRHMANPSTIQIRRSITRRQR